jgi:prepilin-type N-terminal cleavage/methylation domain-containing protein
MRSVKTICRTAQRGFSLIEVLVAIVVLTVGMVSLLGVFGVAIATTQSAQEDQIAKQLANGAMETIFTARDTANVDWQQIQNTGSGTEPDGIFQKDFQPIYKAGKDGIYGTSDDAEDDPQTMTLPGPDGVLGTSDDQTVQLSNFQRKIEIIPVLDSNKNPLANLRQINITIQYHVARTKALKNYLLSGYISQYR